MCLKIDWASNLQKGFTETGLEDVDLPKMQSCKYFVMDLGIASQECRVNYANNDKQ